MYIISEDTGEVTCNIVAIEKQLKEWFASVALIEDIKYPIERLKICLLVEDENKDLINSKLKSIREKEEFKLLKKCILSKHGW